MASVIPLKAQDTLEELSNQWFDAKKREEQANRDRIAIEARILQVHPGRQEGAETVELENGMKLVITGKLTYKADIAQLIELCAGLPEHMRPIKVETKLDESAAKKLRAEVPAAWALIAPAITVSPAKTSITLKA